MTGRRESISQSRDDMIQAMSKSRLVARTVQLRLGAHASLYRGESTPASTPDHFLGRGFKDEAKGKVP